MDRTRGCQPAREVALSPDQRHQTYIGEARELLPFEDRRRNIFSEMLKDYGGKQYRITVKTKFIVNQRSRLETN